MRRIFNRISMVTSFVVALLFGSSPVFAMWENTETISKQELGNDAYIQGMSLSSDGTLLAVGYSSGLNIFNFVGGQWVLAQKLKVRNCKVLNFSPDKSKLAIGDSYEVQIFEFNEGMKQWQKAGYFYPQGLVVSIKFSPDGKTLAAGTDRGKILIFGFDIGKLVLKETLYSAQADHLSEVNFSPDGSIVASAGGYSNGLSLFKASGEKFKWIENNHTSSINTVSFSSAGDLIATAGFDGLSVEKLKENGELSPIFSIQRKKEDLWGLKTTDNDVEYARFLPTGGLVILVRDGSIQIWDADDNNWIHKQTLNRSPTNMYEQARSVEMSSDGYMLVSLSQNKIKVWRKKKPAYAFPVANIEISRSKIGQNACFVSAAFDPSHGHILTGSGTGEVKILNLFDGSIISDISKDGRLGQASVNYSPDGKHGVAIYARGSIALRHFETGDTEKFQSNEDLYNVLFSADSKKILLINRTGKIEVHDTQSFQLQRTFQGAHSCASVTLSPNGNDVMAVCGDGSLNIWDITTGERKLALPVETVSWDSQYFSRGNFIITRKGATVRILNVINGSLKREFFAYGKSDIRSLHAIGDSNNMVAVFQNGDVKIFDDEGIEKASFESKIKPSFSAVTRDGMLFVLDLDSNICIWDTQSLELHRQFSAQCGYCQKAKMSFDHKKLVFPGNDSATVFLFAPNEIEKPEKLADIMYAKLLRDYLKHAESKAVNGTRAAYNYHDFISFIAEAHNVSFNDAKITEMFIFNSRPINVQLYLRALLKQRPQ